VLLQLTNDECNDVLANLACRENISADTIKTLVYKMIAKEKFGIARLALQNPKAPEDEFDRFWFVVANYKTQAALATDENTDVEILKIFALWYTAETDQGLYRNGDLQKKAAENSKTPQDILIRVALEDSYFSSKLSSASLMKIVLSLLEHDGREDEDEDENDLDQRDTTFVLVKVSQHENANPKLLSKLCADKYEDCHGTWSHYPRDLYKSVAENKKTPAHSLAKLAKCKRSVVRQAVAKNPSTSKKTLVALHYDEDPVVRWLVAVNEETPKDVLEHMAENDNTYPPHCSCSIGEIAKKTLFRQSLSSR